MNMGQGASLLRLFADVSEVKVHSENASSAATRVTDFFAEAKVLLGEGAVL